MKRKEKNYSILVFVLIIVVVISCRDESKVIYDTSKLPTGNYARMLALPPDNIDGTISTFKTTTFNFQAEISGASAPSDVKSLDIKVRYLNDKGKVVLDYKALGSITSWALSDNTKLPQGAVSFTGASVLQALSLTTLTPAFQFEFSTTLVMSNGKTFSSENFDPNMTNSFYKAAYDYFMVIDNPAASPDLSWRGKSPLASGSKDTLDIVFNKKIVTLPVVSTKLNYGTLTAPVALAGDKTQTKFYTIFTSTTGTGVDTIKVSGAVSADGNTMASSSATRITDTQAPIASLTWSDSPIGRGQNSTVTITFNEPMSKAPKISISGQNLIPVQSGATVLSSDKLSSSFSYVALSQTPDITTSGDMLVTLTGGSDLAGNALQSSLLSSQALTIDVDVPNSPVITLDPVQYDYGTQIKLTATVGDYQSGSIYFIALTSGTTAPSQGKLSVNGISLNNGFNTSSLKSSNIGTKGNFELSSGTPVFVPFNSKGTYDLYFYFISSTGNVSLNTISPVTVTVK
jgi:hypothetical protein